jgi:hypothetical protein
MEGRSPTTNNKLLNNNNNNKLKRPVDNGKID